MPKSVNPIYAVTIIGNNDEREPVELRLLETFQAVIDHGSLNAAAVELGYAQSTVTQQIQLLEKQLNVQLFHRDGKRLRLSEAGKLLQAHADTLLRHANEIQTYLKQFASGSGGSVRIGSVEPFVSTHLPGILRELLSEPNSMDVSVQVGATAALYEALNAGKLDLVVAPPPIGYTGVLFEPLFFERIAFLIPRSRDLARKKNVTLSDILGERLILSGGLCEYRRAFESAVADVPVKCLSSLTITSVEGRKAAAQAGLGVAMLPFSSVRPVPPETVLRTPTAQNVGVTIGFARRAEALLTPALTRLERLVRQSMSELKAVSAL